MALQCIIRGVCCVALYSIIVSTGESDPLALGPPSCHTWPPPEAFSLCGMYKTLLWPEISREGEKERQREREKEK